MRSKRLGCRRRPPTEGVNPMPPSPPPSATLPVTDTLHGEAIIDPYRWLEADSPETRAWTAAQNAYTASMLGDLPGRAELRERLRALLEIGLVASPKVRGGRLFFVRRE